MTTASRVSEHYGTGSPRQLVEAALDRAGLSGRKLAWSDVAALDQFHVRGLAATRELAEAINPSPDASVLDIGSGLGGPARFLGATYSCRVTGIDLNPGFVEIATLLSDITGLGERVVFREANALALPFEAASFDHAWTQHVAMNIADRAGLYAEIRRVLRPGGRLAVYDVVAGAEGKLVFPVPWARSPEISFLVTPDAMRTLLATSGFREISWSDKTDEGIAWFKQQQAARDAASAPPPLGIHVLMGPEFAAMAGNLGRNLMERRAGLLQAVVEAV